MEQQGSSPHDIAVAVKQICEQFGIQLAECFIKPETLTMRDAMSMIDYIYSHERGRGKRKPTYAGFMEHRSKMKALPGGNAQRK